MNKKDNSRILIIALDGATFDLIKPWVKQGKLPHISGLMQEGSFGDLKSTVPACTYPAWTSFMTGKNPGKHGIFDFTQKKANTYALEFVNVNFRGAETIWKMMSEKGRKVAVLGLPANYPPEGLKDGFVLSGWDTPIASSSDKSYANPPEIYEEIKEVVGKYDFIKIEHRIREGIHDLFLRRLLEKVDTDFNIARYMLKKKDWDCLVVYFGAVDTVCHHFWAFQDSASPRYMPEYAPRYQDAILKVYQKIDTIIGKLLGLTEDFDYTLIISDHGFGGANDKVIYLNRWLEEKGLLSFRRDLLLASRLFSSIKYIGIITLPGWLQKELFHWFSGLAVNKMQTVVCLSYIDWKKTKAYSDEGNTFPQIWLNVKRRDLFGTIEPGSEYEETRNDISKQLLELRDPWTGGKVIKNVYKREELYRGEYLERAPDLVIETDLDYGYSYYYQSSIHSFHGETIRKLKKSEYLGGKGKSMTGQHRENGIFILEGKGVNKNLKIKNLSILDIAPTILYLLGLSIPDDMDGRVITESIYRDYLDAHSIKYVESKKNYKKERRIQDYTLQQAEEIREKLRSLGYLE